MRIGIGIGISNVIAILAAALGITTWAGNLLGSTDSLQIVQTIDTPDGITTVPTNALAFGTSPSDAGVLRFPATSSAVTRLKAGGGNLGVITLGALDAVTLGDASGGIFTIQGSKVSLKIGATERAFVDASGLTIPGMTTGRVVTTTTGGLLVDVATVAVANLPDASGTKGILALAGNLGGSAGTPTVTGLTIPSEARGDILFRNATVWARLAAGTAGLALLSGGAGADVAYGAINLASAAVTGVLAGANMGLATVSVNGGITLAGDLGGTGTAAATPRIGTLTGVSGVVTGPATALTIGATVASTGALRLTKDGAIVSRNVLGTLDVNMISTDGANSIIVGEGTNASSTLLLRGTTAGGMRLQLASTTYLQLSTLSATFSAQLLSFDGNAGAITIQQAAKSADALSTSTTLAAMTASAGATTAANKAGGVLQLQGGGRKDSAGKRGAVRIQLNASATENMLEACDVQPEGTKPSRVLSLLRSTAITTTEMPSDTGDLVMFIGNCAVAPTATSVAGVILYAEGGALKCRGTSGTITTLAAA